jgi:hypothetical protein
MPKAALTWDCVRSEQASSVVVARVPDEIVRTIAAIIAAIAGLGYMAVSFLKLRWRKHIPTAALVF